MKKTEFSKVILYVLWISTTVVVLLSFILMFRTGDLSPLSYILGGLFAELTSATGFYYWKAKNENLKKYENNNIEEMETSDNEYDNR